MTLAPYYSCATVPLHQALTVRCCGVTVVVLAEARLLESKCRSMRLRVSDQIESERRAALSAGRRKIEREMSARLAEEQSASLEQQQVGCGLFLFLLVA